MSENNISFVLEEDSILEVESEPEVVEPESVVLKEDPVLEVDPESEKEAKLEPVQEIELEPEKEIEPESIQEVEPESIQEVEPESIQEVEPESIQEVEPESIQEVELEPVQEVVSEPVQEVEPEPVQEVEPEPVQEIVSEPVQEIEPEPVQEIVSEPVQEIEPEPKQESKTEYLQEVEPEPVQEIVTEVDPIIKSIVPKIVFIVPYRDREQQYQFFSNQMRMVMSDVPETDYKIYYAHQMDQRGFNRGAMKNIGFLAIKALYPNDYKNITFVFNDVDTMPYTKNFLNYATQPGNIKHFYGFDYTLGGIVSIVGSDFEKLNGYPNFWAWGFEDNQLNKRAKAAKINIDRKQFFKFMDKNILQLPDGIMRSVNRTDFDQYMSNTQAGISSIRGLTYDIDHNTGFINIKTFMTESPENLATKSEHDLRKGAIPFKVNRFAAKNPRFGLHFM